MSVEYEYDFAVIGAGAAGSTCLWRLHEQKPAWRLAQIEKEALGGTCLNYGCDPTKTLLHTAQLLHEARQGDQYGVNTAAYGVNWTQMKERVRAVQEKMLGGSRAEAHENMRAEGIDLLWGEAHFVDAHTLQVGERRITAARVLVATGATAVVPDIPGLADTGYLTNEEALYLETLPDRLAIIGAGPIGVEFAQLFTRLGVRVTLVEAETHILPRDDAHLAAQLETVLQEEGVALRLQTNLTRVQSQGNAVQLVLEQEGQIITLETDALLMAVGRRPVLAPLQLAAASIETDEQGVPLVDDYLRTSQPHIWAAGDLLGAFPFTHYAGVQGRYVADTAVTMASGHETPAPFAAGPVPWVTFTDPEMAHVGQTEADLQAGGTPYTVYEADLSVPRALATGQTTGGARLLVDDHGRVLGAHILAPSAGELIVPMTLLMAQALPLSALDTLIIPYPTLSQLLHAAVRS